MKAVQQTAPVTNDNNQPELTEGLFVLELEERLELAAAAGATAGCERCDVEL
jgi:hypothetical protein